LFGIDWKTLWEKPLYDIRDSLNIKDWAIICKKR
jgi:ubiquinone biosynthesis protein Coq4